MVNSEAMRGTFKRVVGLDDAIVRSDTRLTDYIRANIGTYCHALGTVPMGADDERFAVLDHRFKLRGLDGLFVVDASVFPQVPRAVPNLTIMMFAERAAGWIATA
jgi:choline dehydrogenase-like flavoprotein